jgi:2-keto-3-deoxy-L-rhamnonate aldolase RhmA
LPEVAAFQNAYNIADEKGLDVTYFGASSLSKPNGYIAYGSSGRTPMTIDTSGPQAAVVEAHNTRPPDNSASRGR